MNKDVHDMDDLFRSALEGHEETPSAAVKKNLEAILDKKDAESYKRKWIIWKRTALLLLLLLSGFILFDSGLLQTGKGWSSEKTIADKPNSPETARKINNVTEQKNNLPDELNKDENNIPETENENIKAENYNQPGAVAAINSENGVSQKNIIDVNIANPGTAKKFKKNNEQQEKTNEGNAALNYFKEKNKEKPENIFSNSGNNNIITVTPDEEMVKWILYPAPSIEITNAQKKVAGLKQKNIPAIDDSLMKINSTKKPGEEKNNRFNPFWLLSGLTSYEFAGYKLDSDEPSAITSVKYREAHEPSFSSEILLTRQFTRRFGLQSGFIYANTTIGMKPQKTYAFRDPTGDVAYKYITSSGYAFIKPGFGPQPVVGDSLTTAEAKHTLENITVPLVVKFKVLDKKISITPGAGIEANFITKANLEVDIEDPFNREIVVVKKLNGTKSFYWSFVADAELRYNVNNKMAVTIRPVYRHAVSPITNNNVIETFPHSFGIGAGLTFKLK